MLLILQVYVDVSFSVFRQYELTYLEWQEWECVDLIDHIIPIVHNKLVSQKYNKACQKWPLSKGPKTGF